MKNQPVEQSQWPHYSDEVITRVADVLRSGKVNYWTGELVSEFEDAYALLTRRKHAIAVQNGTLALELALKGFDIGPGDEVITTPRTFIATTSSIVLQGATPVFADVDPYTQNITAETIEAKITPATKAILPVHLGGWPCDMEAIMALAGRTGIRVIEDCAQAHGAEIHGRPVGSFGDAAAFSFCQDKIITTGGEGGMLVLDDDAVWKKAWAFKDHGKDYDAVHRQGTPGAFRWLHASFGTNWRMMETQAAIGLYQLGMLDEWVGLRARNAEIMRNHLQGLPAIAVPWPRIHERHAFYRLYAQIDAAALLSGESRDSILTKIASLGVRCGVGSCSEIYLEEAFRDRSFRPAKRLENARRLGETCLAFLVHPTMSEAEATFQARVVRDVVLAASMQ